MEGPSGGGDLRVSRLGGEPGRPVLEHDPRPRRDDARSEGGVEALDQRDGHAVAVDGAEVRRAARLQRERDVERGIGPDERAPGSKAPVREDSVGSGPSCTTARASAKASFIASTSECTPGLEALVEREREQGRDALARSAAARTPRPRGTERRSGSTHSDLWASRSSSESQVTAAIAAASSPS